MAITAGRAASECLSYQSGVNTRVQDLLDYWYARFDKKKMVSAGSIACTSICSSEIGSLHDSDAKHAQRVFHSSGTIPRSPYACGNLSKSAPPPKRPFNRGQGMMIIRTGREIRLLVLQARRGSELLLYPGRQTQQGEAEARKS